MKLDKIIAVRTDKTVYRDGNLAIKVFDAGYSKANILNGSMSSNSFMILSVKSRMSELIYSINFYLL